MWTRVRSKLPRYLPPGLHSSQDGSDIAVDRLNYTFSCKVTEGKLGVRTKELVIYVDIDGVALCDPKGAATTGGSDDVEYRVLKQYPFTRVRSWTNEVSRARSSPTSGLHSSECAGNNRAGRGCTSCWRLWTRTWGTRTTSCW